MSTPICHQWRQARRSRKRVEGVETTLLRGTQPTQDGVARDAQSSPTAASEPWIRSSWESNTRSLRCRQRPSS
jgi:hypothetical protein